jgi:ParB-like chromosome segregation protein Spo0J
VSWQDRIESVTLDPFDVDLEDGSYYIPCFVPLDGLVKSVAAVGIVTPPVLQERSGQAPVPVLGRRRLRAAALAGRREVEARLLPEDMPESEAFALAFWDNLPHRTFDPATTAMVVKRLLELFSRDAVAATFLPTLGLKASGPRLERLRAVGSLEEPVLNALGTGRILERTAELLTHLSVDERTALFHLTQQLRLNSNKAAEVVEHLFDLSVFRETSVLELLRNEELSKTLDDSSVPVPEKAYQLRNLLLRWKFPELTKKEDQFRRRFGSVAASRKISIRHDPSFERDGLSIEINAKSWDEAERILERLREDPS